MEQFLTDLLASSQGLGAYALIFTVLVACGLGLPMPEDISLVLGGFLAHLGAARLPVMVGVGFAGILCGDTLIFFAGRRVATRLHRMPALLVRVVTPEKRAKVQRLFARHGEKIVMAARFLPGVRAVTYFTAGSAGMKYARFILFDGIAALGSAPIFVYLGFRFGSHLEMLIREIKRGETTVIVCLLALAIGLLLYRRQRAAAASRMKSSLELSAAASKPSLTGQSGQNAISSTLNSAADKTTAEATPELGSRTW